jgi:Fic family protein
MRYVAASKDIPSQINTPGEYRTSQVSAGDYLPPDHLESPGLMAKFIDLVNDRRLIEGLGPLLRALVAHFYLVSISSIWRWERTRLSGAGGVYFVSSKA